VKRPALLPLTLLFFTIPVVLTLLAGCGSSGSEPKKMTPPKESRAPAAVHADVVEVLRGDASRPLVITGTILPAQESNVGAKIAGRIERILVEDGMPVRQGAIIFRMEQRELEMAEKAARAGLAMAEASLREATLTLENVTRDKERMARLYETRTISRQKYDDITTAHALALSRIDLAKAHQSEADANLNLALQRFRDVVVTAPFSGMVVKKYVNEAEVIGAGVPVIAIMNIDRVKAEVEIPENHLTAVRRGAAVDVALDALSQEVFRSEVSRLNTRVNPQSRSFKAEIDIANPDQRIKPGMFARITIATNIVRNAIVLPSRAVVTDERGNAAVFVVKNDRAGSRRIRPGLAGDSLIEVREGLAAGERVVVAGNYGMEENTLIAPRNVSY
jgi:RND family efflux transporter MFP subunit